jgi:hypothetical protein
VNQKTRDTLRVGALFIEARHGWAAGAAARLVVRCIEAAEVAPPWLAAPVRRVGRASVRLTRLALWVAR